MRHFFSVILITTFFTAYSTSTVSVDDEPDSSASVKNVLSSDSGSDKSSSSVSGENCFGEPGKVWDGTSAKSFACGSGTKPSPFIILTAEQLAYLSFVTGASDS